VGVAVPASASRIDRRLRGLRRSRNFTCSIADGVEMF